jgi:WD40 repeat protein
MSPHSLFAGRTAIIVMLAVTPSAACSSGGGDGGAGGDGGGGSTSVLTLAFPLGIRGGSPRFSPDGTLLAYARGDGGTYQAAVMTPAGASSRMLASDGNYLTAMAWTSTGAELVYSGDSGIRAVPLAGGPGRLVVGAFAAVGPDLSPDGSSIVYGVNGGTMRLADLRATPAVESDLGVVGSSPRFSPDGSTIAFWGGGKVKLMDVASKAVTDVIDASNDFGGVDWFSDGQRLLAGTERGVEIVTLGATPGRTLLRDVFALLDVDLSPDDKSVAFGVNGQDDLYVLTGF